ncbi:hypothetical protein LEN26_002417 [Aphanomyces euteiches]|nr:hypothetical protein LEN26_002417 [Aphanomyces euteiches]
MVRRQVGRLLFLLACVALGPVLADSPAPEPSQTTPKPTVVTIPGPPLDPEFEQLIETPTTPAATILSPETTPSASTSDENPATTPSEGGLSSLDVLAPPIDIPTPSVPNNATAPSAPESENATVKSTVLPPQENTNSSALPPDSPDGSKDGGNDEPSDSPAPTSAPTTEAPSDPAIQVDVPTVVGSEPPSEEEPEEPTLDEGSTTAITTTEAAAPSPPSEAAIPTGNHNGGDDKVDVEPDDEPTTTAKPTIPSVVNDSVKSKSPTKTTYTAVAFVGFGLLCLVVVLRRRQVRSATSSSSVNGRGSTSGAYAKISNPNDPYDDVDDMDWQDDPEEGLTPSKSTGRRRLSPEFNPFSRSSVPPTPKATPTITSPPPPPVAPQVVETRSKLHEPINPFAMNHDVFSDFDMVPQVKASIKPIPPPPASQPMVQQQAVTQPTSSSIFSMDELADDDTTGWDEDDWTN